MAFKETPFPDGTVEVDLGPRKLSCTVCDSTRFHERRSIMASRAAALFRVDWASDQATNYVCAQCGYVFWFLRD